MRDIPMFTTEYGVASLILKEIPYRQEAYIRIRATQQPKELLEECVGFCRAAGAEKIYAEGHEVLEGCPLHTIVYEMRGECQIDETLVENLWPVTEQTVGQWRKILNERMAGVDNSGYMEARGEKEFLEIGGGYFVHRQGELLGIGWLADDELKAVAAVKPGAGERVMHTLLSLAPAQSVRLEVVSTNYRAIRLYEKLGFMKTAELRRWYRAY